MAGRSIPGVTTEAKTDLPVLLPYDPQQTTKGDDLGFSRWLGSLPPWSGLALLTLIVLWPAVATAQSKYTYVDAFGALWKWLPFLVKQGFFFNVIISLMTMLIGTAAGTSHQ